jgi:hypothetical protein
MKVAWFYFVFNCLKPVPISCYFNNIAKNSDYFELCGIINQENY